MYMGSSTMALDESAVPVVSAPWEAGWLIVAARWMMRKRETRLHR